MELVIYHAEACFEQPANVHHGRLAEALTGSQHLEQIVVEGRHHFALRNNALDKFQGPGPSGMTFKCKGTSFWNLVEMQGGTSFWKLVEMQGGTSFLCLTHLTHDVERAAQIADSSDVLSLFSGPGSALLSHHPDD